MNRPSESLTLRIASVLQDASKTTKSAYEVAGEIEALLVEEMAQHLTENNP